MVPVTVIVLTLDEEANVRECLTSAQAFSDDVHVLDSGSTDATVAIARSMGVAIHHNRFTGFGDQRNWAIDHIPHRYDWVLHLDADERPTEDFLAELQQIVASSPAESGFFVPNKLMLGERWLRRCSGYPVYQVRLFHRRQLRFANHGHGQREVADGTLGYMREPYLHFAFSKGLVAWMEKHARYAAAEAALADAECGLAAELHRCLTGDAVARRRAMKRLSFRLPARPLLRMLEILLLRRGLLDGRAGWTYARMMAAYEAMLLAYRSATRQGVPLSPNDGLPTSECDSEG